MHRRGIGEPGPTRNPTAAIGGNTMKKLIGSLAVAGLAILVLAATVAAAGPGSGQGQGPAATSQPAGGTVAGLLGLTQAEVMAQRHDGSSLAQIAGRQGVDPVKLVDALAARWTERIEARVDAGALTAAEAAQLKSQVALRAKDMVEKTTVGGMHGAAVGAGNAGRHGAGAGSGAGSGACDGTGAMGGGRFGATQP
jgi:hypothetical protein